MVSALLILLALALGGAGPAAAQADDAPHAELAAGAVPLLAPAPTLSDRFQYQLQGPFIVPTDRITGVRVYSLDGWDTPASTVAWLRGQGAYPVCYFSAGSFEDWRPDAGQFLTSDRGAALSGWPGEAWLDVRSANVRRIMAQRMQMCKDKGFLAVDADNVDGYSNKNGIGFTAADQVDYNTWLAATAHGLGLAAGLKNDVEQVPQLVGPFDFFVNEQCTAFNECQAYAPAKAAGKPVFNIEYTSADFVKACQSQAALGMRSIRKDMSLKALPFQECDQQPVTPSPSPSPKPSTSPLPKPSPSPSPDLSPAPKPAPSPSPSPTLGPSPSPKLSPSPSPKATPSPSPSPQPPPSGSWWRPKASDRLNWQYMTASAFTPTSMWVPSARVYVIDLFLNGADVAAAIAARGGWPACSVNVGTYEDWRPDASQIPVSARPNNLWLDTRSPAVRAVMAARLAACKQKGFVAAVIDGADAWSNPNSMGLTAADQVDYNAWLAATAHGLGLAAGLKNDVEQVAQLLPSFDFFVNEECVRYGECAMYTPAKAAGLPVFHVEYGSSSKASSRFINACKCQSSYGITSIYKHTSLDAFRLECTPNTASCPFKSRRPLLL